MSAVREAVTAAQQLLNQSGAKLRVDGKWGQLTNAAFRAADVRTQQTVLAQLAKANVSPESILAYQKAGGDDVKTTFRQQVVPAVLAKAKSLGLNGRLMVAQLRLESGGGGSIPPGSNNWAGIKARPGEPAVVAKTKEADAGGKLVATLQPFRKFDTPQEFVEAYVERLATSKRYGAAYREKDVVTGALALKRAGYATDPQYAVKLAEVAQRLEVAA